MGSPFRRLLAASAVTNLADGISRSALPLSAALLTRHPLLVSGLTTLSFLPWLVFGLVGGALVDRVDRRRAMAVADLTRAVTVGAVGMSVVAGLATIPLLYVAAFALGAAETVRDNAARAALPQFVRRDRLDRGNSLLATQEVVGQSFLGAPAGAALFGVAAAAPLLADAAGYAVAAALALTLPRTRHPVRTRETSLRTDIGHGVRWLLAHRILRDLTILTAVMALGLSMTSAVTVLYALDTLGLSSSGYGLLVAAGGVAAMLGGLLAPRLADRIGRTSGLVASALFGGLATTALGLTDVPALAAGLVGAAALAGTVWDVLALSLRQALVPDELLGRVQGAYRTIVWGTMPLGAALGGVLAARTSVPTVFVLGGAVYALAGAGLWRSTRHHRTDIDSALAPTRPTHQPSGSAAR